MLDAGGHDFAADAPLSRARLSDVARLAGVSAKTVSRVVSGHHSVSPETRQRVLDAAGRLRFRPNHLARDLRRGAVSTTVAFVLGDLGNPFYSQVAAGVERTLAEHGLTMIVAATRDDPAQEERVVAAMLERRVRGLLLIPIAGDQSYLDGEHRLGAPVVCIDRPAQNLSTDSVVFANRAGAAEAVRSLLDHGHRRIAFIGDTVHTHLERLAGYREALRAAGIVVPAAWERTDASSAVAAERAMVELLADPHPPTAVLAGNNKVSTSVLRVLRHSGRAMAFIGFDDFDLAETLAISVVAHDPEDMGRQAVRLALARHADLGAAPAHVVLPTRLIRRGSGESAPGATGAFLD